MTDTEQLLRKAAMAAGYKPIRMTMGSEWPTGLLLEGEQKAWNPLTRNGDAMDLQARLRAEVMHSMPREPASVTVNVYWDDGSTTRFVTASEDVVLEVAPAMRLAITRAAAAIYDSQQEQGE